MRNLAERRKLTTDEARVLGELADQILDEKGRIREEADADKLALFRRLCLRSNSPSLEELKAECRRLVKTGYVFIGWIATKNTAYGCRLPGEYFYLSKELVTTIRTEINRIDAPSITRKRQSVWVLTPEGNFLQIGERLSPEFAARLNSKL